MTKQDAIEKLESTVSKVHSLPAQVWQDLAHIWQPFSAKRKTLLTATGEIEKYLYFVTEAFSVSFI